MHFTLQCTPTVYTQLKKYGVTVIGSFLANNSYNFVECVANNIGFIKRNEICDRRDKRDKRNKHMRKEIGYENLCSSMFIAIK